MKRMFQMIRYLMLERTISQTILLSYLLVNLLLLLLLGLLSIQDSTKILTEEIIASSNKVMEQAASGLSFNLEETRRSLVLLAGNYAAISIMGEKSPVQMSNILQYERSLKEITAGIHTYQSLISDVLILGKNGYVLNLDGRNSLNWEYAFEEQPWVQEAFNTRQKGNFFSLGIHLQDYYLPHDISRYEQPTLSVAMQVRGFGGKVVGAVIANLDLNKINGMFERSAYQSSGNIFLVDENRRIIVHQDRRKIGETLYFEGMNQIDREAAGNFTAKINDDEHLIIYQPTLISGWKMLSTVPMTEITNQSAPIKSNLARILYLCIVLNILISAFITYRISRPVNKLLRTLDRIGEDDGSLYVYAQHYRYRELNYIGNKFRELMIRINQLIEQNYLSQISLKEEELKALQSQINPHFLFNTLQLLQTEIVCGNMASSNHIVVSLSNLFRYSMRQAEEVVELRKEIEHVKDYLYIMNKKYNDRISISMHIPQDLQSVQVPKLILQPIVENSIRHGFGDDRREGSIQLYAARVRRGLLFMVRDNGKGMDQESLRMLRKHIEKPNRKTGNIGLYNVSQRIKLKYGNEYGIILRSSEGAYMTVYLILPAVP
ncbi:sensor histidine kinase [Xylanibacillus composti]|uniref:Sensor histidine kinase n=1 Tax=Xylanibacillus composti TaxID=1572762 RepID=A0A8J4GZR6_9BACL|nr:sensor histidine kinase [Xylanibacillus composti]MDT9724982.1 sensor histidine kinase [Xylanibacillus composti]GIQ68222.1 sensor histidine kinase [Xylanibacillus composti]